MKDIRLIKGILKLYDQNDLAFDGPAKPKLRLSAWKERSNFTAIEIEEIYNDSSLLMLGEEASVMVAFWNTNLTKSLRQGDILYFGSPLDKIGELTITDISD